MKKYTILLAAIVLVLASLACQNIAGGEDKDIEVPTITEAPQADASEEIPTVSPVATDVGTTGTVVGDETEFPIADDAFNVINAVSGVVNYQTNLSLDEAMSFYREEFGKRGYTERSELTNITDKAFNMVFDGAESGKSIIVQCVDFGDGTVNVSINYTSQ